MLFEYRCQEEHGNNIEDIEFNLKRKLMEEVNHIRDNFRSDHCKDNNFIHCDTKNNNSLHCDTMINYSLLFCFSFTRLEQGVLVL